MLFKERHLYKNNTNYVDFLCNILYTVPLFYRLRITCHFTFISYESVIKVHLSCDCIIISPLIVSQHLAHCLTHDRYAVSIHQVNGVVIVFYST